MARTFQVQLQKGLPSEVEAYINTLPSFSKNRFDRAVEVGAELLAVAAGGAAPPPLPTAEAGVLRKSTPPAALRAAAPVAAPAASTAGEPAAAGTITAAGPVRVQSCRKVPLISLKSNPSMFKKEQAGPQQPEGKVRDVLLVLSICSGSVIQCSVQAVMEARGAS